LDDICIKCNYACVSLHFQRNFKNWTSNNNDIDKFVQSTQLSAHDNVKEVLEWIPYDRFHNIKYITEGKFNKMYKANWIDGYINKWDDDNQNWKREKPNIFVILKILNSPASVISKFINKV
jgi:hypothetical protein